MSLSNEQFDALMRSYENQRAIDIDQMEAHVREVEARIPRIREIRKEISDAAYKAAKERLMNPSAGDASDGNASDASDQMLSRRLKALTEERTALLKKYGYPEDYMEIKYRCPDCRDTGFIGNQRCHCFRQAAIRIVYRQSHIMELLETQSFDDFSLDFYSDRKSEREGTSPKEAASRALTLMKKFSKDFKTCGGNVFLYGETGTGKTFLTNCSARALLDQGISVIYFTAFQFFQLLEKHVFDHDHTLDEDYDNIFSCEVLIIDDLGTEMKNSFTTAQMFQVINERLIRRRSTIITTNLSLGDLRDRYGERVLSRITSNYTLIKLFGKDVRLQKSLEKK
jgi:DNA replication protein DnaC